MLPPARLEHAAQLGWLWLDLARFERLVARLHHLVARLGLAWLEWLWLGLTDRWLESSVHTLTSLAL